MIGYRRNTIESTGLYEAPVAAKSFPGENQ
jgi:hypothetical protein